MDTTTIELTQSQIFVLIQILTKIQNGELKTISKDKIKLSTEAVNDINDIYENLKKQLQNIKIWKTQTNIHTLNVYYYNNIGSA